MLFMDSLRVGVSRVPGIFICPTGPLMGEATYIMSCEFQGSDFL